MEAYTAKRLVDKACTLTGPLLKLDVMHAVSLSALASVQTKERAELVKALILLEKLA